MNIRIGNEISAEILLRNGAKVNAQDMAGETPIMSAISNGTEYGVIT